MSLDKAINSGKEKRKKYRGAKAVDASCQNHGGCPACKPTALQEKNLREIGEAYGIACVINEDSMNDVELILGG